MMRRLLLTFVMAATSWGQNTPKYPTSIPTHEDLLIVSNRASDELAAGISSGATSITLTDASEFPALGANQATAIRIGNEYIKICGKTGNVLTVCSGGRGFDGSTPASHSIGAAVTGTYIGHLHNQLAAELISLTQTRLFPCRSSVELTISSGIIVVPKPGCYRLDTEADAPSDDVTVVECVAGDVMVFWPENGDRTVVLKGSLGILDDFYLDDSGDQWYGLCRATDTVREIARSPGVN